jgi:hypothetical protein
MGRDGRTRETGGMLLDPSEFEAEPSDGDEGEGGKPVGGGLEGGRGVVVAMG